MSAANAITNTPGGGLPCHGTFITDPHTWCGHTNSRIPKRPTPAHPSTSLFADPDARREFWLPDPPPLPDPSADAFPELRAFWTRLGKDVTEYRAATVKTGPAKDVLIQSNPASGVVLSEDWVRLNARGRQSRSPNWSGTTVHAVDGAMLTQVVGSWREPDIASSGSFTTTQEFRSSVWIGFNGHAAYYDAALPQIGTMQQIVHEPLAGNWQTLHWVWFEWWANTKANDIADNLLPVYLALDVQPGDTVLCSVELIPGDPARDLGRVHPYVARMCVCVEHLDTSVTPPVLHKVLVMPFIVFPPVVDSYQVRATGSTASWIAERPTNIDKDNPFLMPRFVDQNQGTLKPVHFEYCAAALAPDAGQAPFAEQTLDVSRRIHMISRSPDTPDAMAKIATTLPSPSSHSSFDVLVEGSHL